MDSSIMLGGIILAFGGLGVLFGYVIGYMFGFRKGVENERQRRAD